MLMVHVAAMGEILAERLVPAWGVRVSALANSLKKNGSTMWYIGVW